MQGNNNILVLIQLVGGNDSLSTLVPLPSYDNLAKHRRNILIPANQLLANGDVGFHPATEGFFRLFQEGKMCVVNNTGYPMPNRSHFRSMDIWNSGSPSDARWNTGWLGRLLDLFHAQFPENYPNEKFPDPLAVTIGNIASDTCQGKYHNFSHVVDSLDTFIEVDKCPIGAVTNKTYAELWNYLDSSIRLTNHYSRQIAKASKKGNSLAAYPENNQLAQGLKIAARLISGGLNSKIYVLGMGGFDTHANQTAKTNPSLGMHSLLLKNLSDAVSAFIKDLERLSRLDHVCVMTYSEFGRQIKSNGAFGTDHGDATSIYLFGNQFKKPQIGELPIINAKIEKQSGLDMEIDFRHLYGSLLHSWFELPEPQIHALFELPYKSYQLFKNT